MRGTRSASAAGVAALLITLLASPSAAQDESRQRAPSIRVYSQSGPIASNYVTPAIEVSEDAYVFAVSLDLDGQIQVLHPAFPGISVRMLSHKQLRLPNFFAGFSHNEYDGSGRYVNSSDYVGGDNDSRGSVIALASRAPFNLERVESDGDWNISAIRRLIEHRPPPPLHSRWQPTSERRASPSERTICASPRPSTTITTRRVHCIRATCTTAATALVSLSAVSRCSTGVAQLRHGGRSVSILGYDFCGMPIVAYGPSPNTRNRPRTPRDPSDTLVTKGHVRPPRAAIGTFSLTRGTGTPQAGDVLITPPRQNRRDRREIFADPPNEGRVGGLAERSRVPTERRAPPRVETGFIGTLPAREYPRPIVREAPVAHERPTSPPPPPPRTQSQPQSRSAPLFVRPPPRH